MTFQKGQSGNPAGRPPGSRGKASLFAEALSAGDAQEIIQTAINKAKEGDIAAVRLCLDRIAPRPRDAVVDFELPALHSAESALSAVADIAAAVGRGDLTPAQANDLTRVVERFLRAHENVDLEQRIRRFEEQCGIRQPDDSVPANEVGGLAPAGPSAD